VAKQLIAHGKVERGWLGISIQDLTPDLAKKVHVEVTTKGALVVDVVKGGPAERGGLKKNDVVIAYRGKEIPDSGRFRNEVANTPIGSEAKVTIVRAGKREDLVVKVGSLEESTKFLAAYVKERLGAEVRAIPPKEAEKYGLDMGQGVMINQLEAKGPLQKAGFEVGDMILEVNSQPVKGVDAFIQLVSVLKPGQKIMLLALDHRSGNMGNLQVVVR
jgi:serine protease Do